MLPMLQIELVKLCLMDALKKTNLMWIKGVVFINFQSIAIPMMIVFVYCVVREGVIKN